MPKDILISDLTRCQPSEAISNVKSPRTWLTATYEIDEGSGVMLFGLPDYDAPTLTLPLNVRGWYEIRFGIWYPSGVDGIHRGILRVKLTGDPYFNHIANERHNPENNGYLQDVNAPSDTITEVFWKCAEVSEKQIIITRPPFGALSSALTNIAYVRLIPMDNKAIADWQHEQPSEPTRTMVGFETGFFEREYAMSQEAFREKFAHFQDTDFDIVLYRAASGTTTLYPSTVGQFILPNTAWAEHLYNCVSWGLDPLREAIKAAHECGIKLFIENQLHGVHLPPHHDRMEHGGAFMADHPELLCRFADGEAIRHLSLGFEEVQDFHIRLLREWVSVYDADGVCIPFDASWPFVLYEPPVCEVFQEMHGESMRALPEFEPRVREVRASFVTEFLRKIRLMLDTVGASQDRRIPTCYPIPVRPQTDAEDASAFDMPLNHGLDVAAWVQEGLVDYLLLKFEVHDENDSRMAQKVVRSFADLTRDTHTTLVVDINPITTPPQQIRQIAEHYYEAGADRLSVSGTQDRYRSADEWSCVRRLGHRDDLETWCRKNDNYRRTVPIRRLDGFVMGRPYSGITDG